MNPEIIAGLALLAWNLAVIGPISKWAFEVLRASHGEELASYITRKAIHVLGGGVSCILTPLLFASPAVPVAMALALAITLLVPHMTGKLLKWFQRPGKISEVYFCLVWAASTLTLWSIDPWIAMLPLTYMSLGDGVTGITRALTTGKQSKTWTGTLAFLATCTPIGYAALGPAGALSGVAAALAERTTKVDDNLTVPLAAIAVIVLAKTLLA